MGGGGTKIIIFGGGTLCITPNWGGEQIQFEKFGGGLKSNRGVGGGGSYVIFLNRIFGGGQLKKACMCHLWWRLQVYLAIVGPGSFHGCEAGHCYH